MQAGLLPNRGVEEPLAANESRSRAETTAEWKQRAESCSGNQAAPTTGPAPCRAERVHLVGSLRRGIAARGAREGRSAAANRAVVREEFKQKNSLSQQTGSTQVRTGAC